MDMTSIFRLLTVLIIVPSSAESGLQVLPTTLQPTSECLGKLAWSATESTKLLRNQSSDEAADFILKRYIEYFDEVYTNYSHSIYDVLNALDVAGDSLVDTVAEVQMLPPKEKTVISEHFDTTITGICDSCEESRVCVRSVDSCITLPCNNFEVHPQGLAIVSSPRFISDLVPTNTQGKQSPLMDNFLYSNILACDVYNSFGIPVTKFPDKPVTLNLSARHFELEKLISDDIQAEVLQVICVFWNSIKEVWSPDGCKLVSWTTTHVTCECDHLTSFAVLMQLRQVKLSKKDETILDLLTKICLSMSIVCLSVTLALYLYLRLYRSQRIVIHVNLAMCLLVADLLFLTGIQTKNELGCTAVAVFLHFCLLSTFFWMMIEGVHLHRNTAPSTRKPLPMWLWMIIGYGPPAFIVILSMAASIEGYGVKVLTLDEEVGKESTNRCWLDADSPIIWAFIAPALAIIIFNIVVLIRLLRVFLALKSNRDKSEVQRIRSGIRAVFILQPLLGVPWIIGLMNIGQATVVFNYVFVVAAGLQGVFIFINQCLLDDEVRKALARTWPKIVGMMPTVISRVSVADGDSEDQRSTKTRPSFIYDNSACTMSTMRTQTKEAWVE